MPGYLDQAMKARANASKDTKKGGGGIGLPKLGIGNVFKMLGGAATGIARLGTSLAPGGDPAGEVWSRAGKGVASSMAGTAANLSSIGPLGVLDMLGGPDIAKAGREAVGSLLGEEYTPKSFGDQYREGGLLPMLVENVGNVAAGASGAGALARLGTVGKLAEAGNTASRALKAGSTLEQVNAATAAAKLGRTGLKDAGISSTVLKQAGKAGAKAEGLTADAATVASRAKALNTLHNVAHPYRSLFENAIKPVTAAATAKSVTGVQVASVPAELAPDTISSLFDDAGALDVAPERAAAFDEMRRLAQEVAASADSPVAIAEDAAILSAQRADALKPYAAEPTVKLYRGGDSTGDFWTDNLAEAKRHQKGNGGELYETEVPESVAKAAREEGKNTGNFGESGAGAHVLGEEWKRIANAVVNDSTPLGGVKLDAAGAAKLPEYGPVETLVRRSKEDLVPEWATKTVDKLPDKVVAGLSAVDNFIEARKMQRVLRERTRMSEVARRKGLHSQFVTIGKAAGDMLRGKELPDGTIITPLLADQLVGDAMITQLDITDALARVAGTTPEQQALIRRELAKIVGAKDQLPQNWLEDAAGNRTPLGTTIDDAVAAYRAAAPEKLDILSGTRVGPRGLEQVGDDVPAMSKRSERLLAQAIRNIGLADKLAETRIPKEIAAAEAQLAKRGDAVSRIAARIEDLKASIGAQQKAFERSREYVPKAMRTDDAWASAVDTVVAETLDNGGATFDPHEARLLQPAGQGGGDTGYVVGATRGPVLEIPLTGQKQTDAAAIAQGVDSVAKEYQDLLIQRSVSIGTYVDDNNVAHIELNEIFSNRDDAILMATARQRNSVYDMGLPLDNETAFIDTSGRADVAAQFVENAKNRQRYAKQLRRVSARSGITAKEVDVQMALNDIIASSMSRADPERFPTPDSVYAQLKAVIKGKGETFNSGDLISGEFHNVLTFFENADATTLVRNHAKALRQMLNKDDIRALEARYGIKNGIWTGVHEARFARDFETFLANSTAPPGMDDYFAQIRGTMSDLWRVERTKHLSGMDELFDRVLNPSEYSVGPADVAPTFAPLDAVRGRMVDGVYVQSELSAAQRLQSTPFVPDMSAPEAYSRGVRGAKAVASIEATERKIADLASRKSRLERNMNDIRKTLTEEKLKSQVMAQRSRSRADRLMERIAEDMNDPRHSDVPPEWQPVWAAIEGLHKSAESLPELAAILEDFPAKWDTVLRIATENGFRPEHVRSFQPSEVRQLVYGNVRLGKKGRDIGQTMIAGTMNKRAQAFSRTRSLSALAGAMIEANNMANTNAVVDFIQDVYAKKVEGGVIPKGFKAWDPERSFLLAGEKMDDGSVKVEGLGAPTWMIPKQVYDVLKMYQSDFNHPILNALKTGIAPWRALLLTFSPRWYVNNFVGNLALATKEGVRPVDWVRAWTSYRLGGPDSNKAFGRRFGAGKDAFGDAIGAFEGGFASEMGEHSIIRYPRGKEGFKLAGNVSRIEQAKLVTDRIRNANDVVDKFARVAVYHSNIRRGMTEAQALQRTYEALVDYGDLSPFQRDVVRSVMPFFAWQKGVMKLAAKFPIDHPVAASIAASLNRMNQDVMADKYGGELPEAYSAMMDLPIIGNVNTRGINPFLDSGTLTSPQGIASAMNPFFEAGIRNALGAPEGGYVKHRRVDQFGNLVPDTNILEDVKNTATGLPQIRVGEGLSGKNISGIPSKGPIRAIGSFAGVPSYTDAEVRKMVKRIAENKKNVK